MTEDEATAEFHRLMKSAGKGRCNKCGAEVGRGAVAWNNPSTEAGTGYTVVTIECESCGADILIGMSWWPGADSFEELVECVLPDIIENPSSQYWATGSSSET